jgi:hypothetical protein
MLPRSAPHDLYDWISPIGGNWAFWAINPKLVGEFIHAHELQEATLAPSVRRGAGPAMAPKESAAGPHGLPLVDLGIRGGIRVAHLHFENRIYMLDDKQWAEFSKGIVAEFKAALGKVNQVSFEQAMVLGSMAPTLPKG